MATPVVLIEMYKKIQCHYVASRVMTKCDRKGRSFLAHWIRISDILSWIRNYNLIHIILPRLSREHIYVIFL